MAFARRHSLTHARARCASEPKRATARTDIESSTRARPVGSRTRRRNVETIRSIFTRAPMAGVGGVPRVRVRGDAGVRVGVDVDVCAAASARVGDSSRFSDDVERCGGVGEGDA